MSDAQIEALLNERAGYERRGLKDRAAQVDEALKAAGYKAAQEPKKRTAPPRSEA